MKPLMSKTEAQEKINRFFKRKSFKSEDVRKIKRLAMSNKIKLGALRKNFCKKCLSKLKGKIRISKTSKTITCSNCSYKNKFTLS